MSTCFLWKNEVTDPCGGIHKGRDTTRWHRGSQRDLLRAHERDVRAVHDGALDWALLANFLINRVADARTMCEAYRRLRQQGGAPGPDRLGLDLLEGSEIWSLCRALATSVGKGLYRPGPQSTTRIPRGNGKPPRSICIQNISDRVVAKACLLILQPLVDPFFSPMSVGFRPGLGPQDGLALAAALAETQGRWVWVGDDVRSAFDQVSLDRLLEICANYFPEPVVALLRHIADTGKSCGVRQGSPLSPFLWNIFADDRIDRPFVQGAAAGPLLRYADDLLLLCRDSNQAWEAYSRLAAVAQESQVPLKKQGQLVFNLASGEAIQWLGYHVSRSGGQLSFTIAADAWDSLGSSLAAASEAPAASLTANHLVQSWLDSMGPCFEVESRNRVLRRLQDIAGEFGFDELPNRRRLRDYWQRSYARWCRLKHHRLQTLPSCLAHYERWSNPLSKVRKGPRDNDKGDSSGSHPVAALRGTTDASTQAPFDDFHSFPIHFKDNL